MFSLRGLRVAARAARVRPQVPVQRFQRFQPLQRRTYAIKENNEPPKLAWFLLVSVFGTLMFVYAANKVNEQDANRSLAKRKKTFTEEEWEEQLSQIKRKQLVFDDSTKFYLVPFGAHKEAKVEELKSALGPNTAVIDLNELIKQQMDSPESTYGALLGKTLDGFDTNKSACFYTFTYRLAPGLFTKLVKTTSQKLKAQNPELTNFVLLNYPNTIPEAIKFEQDVAVAQKLVLLDNQETDSNIVDYFRTVNKVADLDQLKK